MMAAIHVPFHMLLTWASAAFAFWAILMLLLRPRDTPSVLVTACISWIGAGLLLWSFPTILRHLEDLFGA